MKLTTLLCLLLFITSITQAQEKIVRDYGRPPLVSGIAELKIGDEVPDILIDNIINNDKRSIRTADYKDKLLVLDFWDTTCATCIESMPKLDSLQAVFGERIKLLSVTWQPEEMITKFFKTNRFLNERTPPVLRASVVDDRALRSYFRYEGVPHVIWIYKGKVVAITEGEYITAGNIQTLLDGKEVDWILKTERFDTTIPFVSLNTLWQDGADSPDFGYSVLTGQVTSVPSLGGINYIQDKVHNQSRIAIYNQSIFTTYQMLLYNTKPDEITYGVHPARVTLEVKNPSRFLYKEEYGEQTDWNKKNLINYEMVKSGTVEEIEMAKLAVEDLNTRLKINGRYEMRKVKCLVFVKTDKPITDTLAQESGGRSIAALIIFRLDGVQKYPPAIDETGFTGGLRMQPDDGSIAGLRKEMQRHGLDLIEAEREIEVMVISDAK